MAAVLSAVVAGFVYLNGRILKISRINNCFSKIAKGRKWLMRLLSLGVVVIFIALISIVWSITNAFVILIHLTLFWAVCDGIMCVVARIRGRQWKRYYVPAIAVFITIVYLGGGYYYANHVFRTDYEITTEKEVGDLTIVQITDSHIGTLFDGDGFMEYIEEINQIHPDIVVVTGDFVDDSTTRTAMEKSCEALGALNAKYGVYYVYGNHDKGYNGSERGFTARDLNDELEKNSVQVLEDESILVDDRFYVIGRQDRQETQRADMDTLVNDLDQSKYMIVLDHQPGDYDAQMEAGVDLVLSGHTHGGQFWPINNLGEWIHANCMTYGHEKRENTDFIVSSGIADWDLKFRTGCISEYVVIHVTG